LLRVAVLNHRVKTTRFLEDCTQSTLQAEID
jgi:hypothetical protein